MAAREPKVDHKRFLALLARATSEDSLLSDLAHVAKHECEADEVDIVLVQGTEFLLRASTMSPEFAGRLRVNAKSGLGGQVIREGVRQVIANNLRQHPTFQDYPGFDESMFVSAIVEPLKTGTTIHGAIYFRRRTKWRPTIAQLSQTTTVSDAVIQTILAYRCAFQAGSLANRRMGAISQVTDILSRSPYLEEILQLLVTLTAQQFGYRVSTVRLLDEENSELVLRATQATSKGYQRKRAIKLGESIAGRVLVEQVTMTVQDVQAEPDYIGHDLAVEQGLRSMICTPLSIQGRAVGVLTCYTDHVHTFETDEIRALETIAKQAAMSIEHAKLQVRHTLMQEMHHRVKNNLQQIVSLLRLQLRHKHYASIEQAINDSLGRILAIASVHDLLSREDLDHVSIKSIAESLIHHQQQSFVPPSKRIRFEVRGDDLRLNMTQATQVALTLNELISNAVEHGFETSNEGDIHVNVEVNEEQVGLWVSNNGDRLPPGFDPMRDSHLGLQIVNNLARGLGGSFLIEDRLTWTVCQVLFTRQTSE